MEGRRDLSIAVAVHPAPQSPLQPLCPVRDIHATAVFFLCHTVHVSNRNPPAHLTHQHTAPTGTTQTHQHPTPTSTYHPRQPTPVPSLAPTPAKCVLTPADTCWDLCWHLLSDMHAYGVSRFLSVSLCCGLHVCKYIGRARARLYVCVCVCVGPEHQSLVMSCVLLIFLA